MFPENPGITGFLNWTNLVIDGIFCVDLLLKWAIGGKSYRKAFGFGLI